MISHKNYKSWQKLSPTQVGVAIGLILFCQQFSYVPGALS